MTIWKPIPGHPNYEAGSDGNIRSIRYGRNLKPRAQKSRDRDDRYFAVRLGRTKNFKVHHLILFAFVGKKPLGCEALHLNDIGTDNRLENLKWGTPSENRAMRKPKLKWDNGVFCSCDESGHDEKGRCHTEGCNCQGWKR